MNLKVSRSVVKTYSDIKFHEIRPVEAELFHADRRTDEAKNRFSQFCERA